ncbi:MAG: hypothetical protein ACRCXA_09480 [Peptostreptococcaceae bacterium]
MKIKFKLNTEDVATLCCMASNINGLYAKNIKMIILIMCICICTRSIYLYNIGLTKNLIFEFIGMLFILIIFISISRNPKIMRKRMIKLAKINIKQTPKILDWQTIEIDDIYITHTQLNSSTKTRLEHIENIVNQHGVIFVFNNAGCICAAIPTSAFKTTDERELFIKLLKKT